MLELNWNEEFKSRSLHDFSGNSLVSRGNYISEPLELSRTGSKREHKSLLMKTLKLPSDYRHKRLTDSAFLSAQFRKASFSFKAEVICVHQTKSFST